MLTQKTFEIDGKHVEAKILSSLPLDGGGVVITVQTGCINREGQTSYQTNEATILNPESDAEVESSLHAFAVWLEKLLWKSPKIVMYMAELKKADGEFMNLTCSIDIRQPMTVIHPTWVEVAKLPRIGEAKPANSAGTTLPVHEATIRFKDKSFSLPVLSMHTPSSAIIGADLVLKAIDGDGNYIFDLFMTDLVRALSNAARSKEKVVLILGSYHDLGMERLKSIKAALKEVGYEGVMLSEFVDIHAQSLFEKMLMFGSMARFIICDESMASGHLMELKACADIGFVVALLRPHGKSPTWMNQDLALGRDTVRAFGYEDSADISSRVKEALDWANGRITERTNYYNRTYPWRNPNVRIG